MATILVVEDDEELNEVLGYHLRQRGHQVRFASNANDALIKLQTAPDLVLLEIVGPRLDGFEICAGLSRRPDTAQVPVVFLTSHNGANDFERARHMPNFAGYFLKPYATLDVLRHIDKVIASRPND
jgi:two-component system phosphate regulon response regulator PhoB